ncbi:MAG TPA: OsmC family protein [Burkholderiales bacterium]|jgi:organic hydroperoxide reductase OsmC/OhrA|nr:OsmC family protein [Burkholderiales bacterium]
MTESTGFTIHLEQEEGFDFRVKFDWPDNPDLLLDEPEPLGHRHGPNAARLVAAAVGNCLSASLVFCLRTKFKQNPGPVRATVTGQLARNERGRMRIGGLTVRIELAESAEALQHLERCMGQFEDFCVVTESIRQGIPVDVEVVDASGRKLHERKEAPALT